MTVRSPSYAHQPDFWANCTIAAAAIATPSGRGAVWTRTGVGVYVLTLDGGGADITNNIVLLDINVAVPFTYQSVQTSDTVKTITVRDIAGNVVEATALRAIAFKLA